MDGSRICVSGGFGNGKSFIAMLKLFIFLSMFPKYRAVVGRQYYKDLKATTMATFFKICPQHLIASHNETDGKTVLTNGSEILWMHLDSFDEQSLRGLEINAAILDQAEEIEEAIFHVLDGRIGRWDQAEVPQEYLDADPNWPRDSFGRPRVKNFFDILCNPDTLQHWIYRRFHPESIERDTSTQYIEAATDERSYDPETYRRMEAKGEEWVEKYMKGKWGASKSQIHFISKASKIYIDDDLLADIRRKGALTRVLDHGDASPTSCLWVAAYKGVYIFYREYYVPGRVIAVHRKAISELSEGEEYVSNFADPQIFKKTAQKDGGFWSVADEYTSREYDAPPISFSPADNNEFATRNRINTLLMASDNFKHPITGESPAPGIYFALPNRNNGTGCPKAISETEMQRLVLVTTDNGNEVYGNEREERKGITDHAYDCVRYYIAAHGNFKAIPKRKPPKNSFAAFNAILEYRKNRAAQPLSAA